MPRLATFLLWCLVSLLTLAMMGCDSAKKAELAKVQQVAQRALDLQEIQNVISRHAYYAATGQYQRELDELWDINTQNSSWANERGYWVDADAIQNYYVKYQVANRAKEAAISGSQSVSTPLIELAQDGYTAKGVWYSTRQIMRTQGGKPTPSYVQQRYYVDFYKPRDRWIIWHFLVRTEWSADGQNWVAGPGKDGADAPLPSETTEPAKNADPNRPAEFPKLPEPYKNFSLTFSYGPPRHI